MNAGANLNLLIELDDVRIVHAKTAMRDRTADRSGPVGAVDPVKGITKI